MKGASHRQISLWAQQWKKNLIESWLTYFYPHYSRSRNFKTLQRVFEPTCLLSAVLQKITTVRQVKWSTYLLGQNFSAIFYETKYKSTVILCLRKITSEFEIRNAAIHFVFRTNLFIAKRLHLYLHVSYTSHAGISSFLDYGYLCTYLRMYVCMYLCMCLTEFSFFVHLTAALFYAIY